MRANESFPQSGMVDLDLVDHPVDVIGLVSSDQGPDDSSHAVHGCTNGLLRTKACLDHSPFMECECRVIDAGNLSNQVQRSPSFVVTSCGQPGFVQRSSRLDPFRTAGPLSRQRFPRIKPGDSSGAHYQSGCGNDSYPGGAVEQIDLACYTDTILSWGFGLVFCLFHIGDHRLIYMGQPLFQQLQLVEQKHECPSVIVFASTGYRALGQLGQISSLLYPQRSPALSSLHSSQRQGSTTSRTPCSRDLPQYRQSQLSERVYENLGELRKTDHQLLVD